jgi:hypothetical protein
VNNSASHSNFVTVVAWVSIVLSGFATLISVLQNILVHTVFSTPEFEQALQTPPTAGTPPFAIFLAAHFKLFFALFLVIACATLASSIGLLKRRNWARIVFIGLMILGIVWNLAGLVIQFSIFASMQGALANVPPEAPDMKAFSIAVATVGVLFAIGFSGLFGWIAKRLLSPEVAAEFR